MPKNSTKFYVEHWHFALLWAAVSVDCWLQIKSLKNIFHPHRARSQQNHFSSTHNVPKSSLRKSFPTACPRSDWKLRIPTMFLILCFLPIEDCKIMNVKIETVEKAGGEAKTFRQNYKQKKNSNKHIFVTTSKARCLGDGETGLQGLQIGWNKKKLFILRHGIDKKWTVALNWPFVCRYLRW